MAHDIHYVLAHKNAAVGNEPDYNNNCIIHGLGLKCGVFGWPGKHKLQTLFLYADP